MHQSANAEHMGVLDAMCVVVVSPSAKMATTTVARTATGTPAPNVRKKSPLKNEPTELKLKIHSMKYF